MAIQVDPTVLPRRRTAIATYGTEAEAVAALRALHQQGLDKEHITLVAKDALAVERVASLEGATGSVQQGESEMFAYRQHQKGRPEIIGALAGALIAILLGLGALAIPGFGTFLLVAGPLAILLHCMTLAAAGLGLGALIGAIVDESATENQRDYYEQEFKAGHWMIVVHGDDQSIGRATSVLDHKGLRRIEVL